MPNESLAPVSTSSSYSSGKTSAAAPSPPRRRGWRPAGPCARRACRVSSSPPSGRPRRPSGRARPFLSKVTDWRSSFRSAARWAACRRTKTAERSRPATSLTRSERNADSSAAVGCGAVQPGVLGPQIGESAASHFRQAMNAGRASTHQTSLCQGSRPSIAPSNPSHAEVCSRGRSTPACRANRSKPAPVSSNLLRVMPVAYRAPRRGFRPVGAPMRLW